MGKFCHYQSGFIFKNWSNFDRKIALFFENGAILIVKCKSSKGGAYKRDFWAIFGAELIGQKIEFHTFLTPKVKNFEKFWKNKKLTTGVDSSNFSKICQFLTKKFSEDFVLSNPIVRFFNFLKFWKNFWRKFKIFEKIWKSLKKFLKN